MPTRSVLATAALGAGVLALLVSGCTPTSTGGSATASASATATAGEGSSATAASGAPSDSTQSGSTETEAPAAPVATENPNGGPGCDEMITPEAAAELAGRGLTPTPFVPSPGYVWHDRLQAMLDAGGVVCQWGGGGDVTATYAWAPADAAGEDAVKAQLAADGWTDELAPDGSLYTRVDEAEPNVTTPFLFGGDFYLSALTTEDLANFTLRTN
ncbi:hypothetical protein HQQ81_03290 [Microbacteriaceae bacterium VKM Ac-2854]|nr:hypothetical protein [Microbacteriaceae bacterium VKM Ac-2854]